MSNKINIDDLLKQEMGNLSPEPPADMWQSISNQLSYVELSPSKASSAKTIAGVSLKSALITLASLAVTSVAYIFLLSNPTPPKALENNSLKADELLASPPKLIQNQSTLKIQELQPPTPKQNSIKNGIIVNSDITDEIVATDYPASVSSPINEIINLDKGAQINDQQNVVENNTEKIQEEMSETQTNSLNQKTTIDEFLKPNIPNVFTPNNDGYNDEFVITIENELLYDLKITDAKGNVVFESRDKNKHWNGTNQRNGEACEPGVYVLAFGYQLKGMSETKVEKGLILLKL
jgi:gliding motility-associated-like protein